MKTNFPVGAQKSDTKYYFYNGSEYKLCDGSHDFSSYTPENLKYIYILKKKDSI